ncbi:hypothetical protein [Gemmatimonas sp.]|uniref:hypothetical protein n=1 Tax=Gemmatimonas sp. TaxID=1962908 RepID=UPI0035698A91
MIVTVDGRVRQFVEFSDFRDGKPTGGRIVRIGERGEVQTDLRADFHGLDIASKLTAADQLEKQRLTSRLLNGLANLVLPDQLHAQAVEDNPCAGWEQALAAAASASIVAGIFAGTTAAACTVVLISCPAFIGAELAYLASLALVVWTENKYLECTALHPYCFDGGYMTNGSCESGSGGGGGSNGSGSGGEPGGSGTASGGGWPSGSLTCNWNTSWGYDQYGNFVTHSWVQCI